MKNGIGLWLALVGLVACEVSPVVITDPPPKAVPMGADAGPLEPCVPKTTNTNTDPNSYPACACAKGGAARCVPSAEIGSGLASQLEACTGGACVPDSIVKSGGAAPATCESPFGEGRCVSLCIPQVGANASALDRGK